MTNTIEKDNILQRLFFTRDVFQLSKLSKKLDLLTDDDLILAYQDVLEDSILCWSKRCLLSYEGYRRGNSPEVMAKEFGVSRQTVWREAEIWEKILSKKVELLKNKWIYKTFFKRVVDLTHSKKGKPPIIKNAIAELERIGQERKKIWMENQKRLERGLQKLPDLTTRRYVREKQGGKVYNCDVCNSDVTKYFKVCEKCKKEIELYKTLNAWRYDE